MGCWNATLTMWPPAVASRRRDRAPPKRDTDRRRETDVPAVTEQGPARRPVIEVLYVEGCPNYRGALALVERVRTELGIDAELRTTLVRDPAAADQARFSGSRPSEWTIVMSSPAASHPPSTPSPVACTGSSTALPVSQKSAGCARPCCGQPAAAERPTAMLRTAGGCQFTPRTILRATGATSHRHGSQVEVDDGRPGHDAAHVRHHGCLRSRRLRPPGRDLRRGRPVAFDELRSTPTEVVLTARATDFGRVVSMFSFQGRRIVTVKDYPSMEAAQAAIAGPSRAPAERWWRRWLRWRPGSRG
jgi:hypothetical protein